MDVNQIFRDLGMLIHEQGDVIGNKCVTSSCSFLSVVCCVMFCPFCTCLFDQSICMSAMQGAHAVTFPFSRLCFIAFTLTFVLSCPVIRDEHRKTKALNVMKHDV